MSGELLKMILFSFLEEDVSKIACYVRCFMRGDICQNLEIKWKIQFWNRYLRLIRTYHTFIDLIVSFWKPDLLIESIFTILLN